MIDPIRERLEAYSRPVKYEPINIDQQIIKKVPEKSKEIDTVTLTTNNGGTN